MKRQTLLDKVPGRHYLRRVMRILTPAARAKLPLLITGFLLISLLDLLGLSLIGPFIAIASDSSYIDNIAPLQAVRTLTGIKSNIQFIAVLGVVIVVLFISKSIAGYAIHLNIIRFARNNQRDLRLQLMRAFQALPVEAFVNHSTAGLLNTVNQHSAFFTSSLLIPGLKALSEFLFLIFLFLYLMFANPWVTLSLAALFGILAFIYDTVIRRRIRTAGEERTWSGRQINSIVAQSAEGFKEIRVAGVEERFRDALWHVSQRYASASTTSAAFAQLPKYLVEASVVTFVIILVVTGLYLYGGPSPELFSILGIFAFAALRSVNSVNAMLNGVNQVRFAEKAVEDLHQDLCEIESMVEHVQPDPRQSQAAAKPTSPIVFDHVLAMVNVSFRYRNTDKDVLSKVSLTIEKGQSIGFIGASGSGKTTLMDILLGLLTPTSGKILVDGAPIAGRSRAWMTHAAYLPQQAFLLDGTVRHNIVLAQREEDIDEEHLNRAIDLAHLHEMIYNLPQQVNTQIGERGIKISGGQRQRIALARAIYSNRDIIFMDEATSSLDQNTEEFVVEAMRKLKGTVTLIVIAHRTSTLRYCDVIFEIVDGRLVRSGTYQEIIGPGHV